MNKLLLRNFALSIVCCVASSLAFAQVPQALNYQAVARNTSGVPIINSSVAVRLSIHDGSAGGTVVYAERETATTNAFGLFTTVIGTGNVISGTFASINWGAGDKYLQVDLDPTGGSSYTDMGTTQLLSVPYALRAGGGVNLMYCIALTGIFPSQGTGCSLSSVGTYIGEIRAFPFNFVPCGWQKCDGTLISIADNNALFALLGTTYGGDGITTFAVPDLSNTFIKGN